MSLVELGHISKGLPSALKRQLVASGRSGVKGALDLAGRAGAKSTPAAFRDLRIASHMAGRAGNADVGRMARANSRKVGYDLSYEGRVRALNESMIHRARGSKTGNTKVGSPSRVPKMFPTLTPVGSAAYHSAYPTKESRAVFMRMSLSQKSQARAIRERNARLVKNPRAKRPTILQRTLP